MEKIKKIFLGLYEYILYHAYIENLFAELYIILVGLLGSFLWDYRSGSFYLTLVLCGIKLLPIPGVKRLYSVYLMRESAKSNYFILFALVNVAYFVFLFFLALGEFYPTVLLSVIYRLFFVYEEEKVQNVILMEGIEEAADLGMPQLETHLAKAQSLEALIQLGNIRNGLADAVEERMQSEKLKTDLITNVSHDLKTPLTSIINYADILSSKEEMDEEAKNYIRILGRNSQRLKSLIVDLIDASKTGAGNVQLEKMVIDFNELVSQVFGDFESELSEKNLEFVYHSDSQDALVYTDPEILGRVLGNLFSNICKYALENTRIYGKLIEDDHKVYFSMKNVSKNRLGISADELMQQFVRGERSRTTEGSGLGLHIAKNLVEALGGEFRLVIDGDYFQVFIELDKD